mmetsp:Transcript_34472/g.79567  ORF Transcript_34472/g.79567 Transcript_34472/m.79567 type:complete len:122 (-) Transcript_34472:15-380(-)
MRSTIIEMKHVLQQILVIDASLEARPTHKVKPDHEAFEKNRALLQEGLGRVRVSFTVDKEAYAIVRKRRTYCGMTDASKFCRCVYKTVYYCSKAHQRARWKDHKPQCTQIRGLQTKMETNS